MLEVILGDDVLTVEQGKCYSYGVDRDGVIFEYSEITHREYKDCVRSGDYEQQFDSISDNVVLHYEDNGGVFFVKSNNK